MIFWLLFDFLSIVNIAIPYIRIDSSWQPSENGASDTNTRMNNSDIVVKSVTSDLVETGPSFDAIIVVDGMPVMERLLSRFNCLDFQQAMIHEISRARSTAYKKSVVFPLLPDFESVNEELPIASRFYVLVVHERSDLILEEFQQALFQCLYHISRFKTYIKHVALTNVTFGSESIPYLTQAIETWSSLHNRRRTLRSVTIVTESVKSGSVVSYADNFFCNTSCVSIINHLKSLHMYYYHRCFEEWTRVIPSCWCTYS